jgi:hypothetical protein
VKDGGRSIAFCARNGTFPDIHRKNRLIGEFGDG